VLKADCVISVPKLKTHKKVGLTVNLKNLDEIGQIITQGKADNDYFYHTFKETLKKVGRV